MNFLTRKNFTLMAIICALNISVAEAKKCEKEWQAYGQCKYEERNCKKEQAAVYKCEGVGKGKVINVK